MKVALANARATLGLLLLVRKGNVFRCSVDHPDAASDTGVRDKPPADDAGGRIRIRPVTFQTDDIDGAANHVASSGGDDCVLFGVYSDTQFVSFALGDVQLLAFAEASVDTVGFAARRSVVAGGDDFVVIDDNRTIAPAQAGAAGGHFAGDV